MILTVLYDHDFLNYIGISAKYDGGEGGGRWGRRKIGSEEAVRRGRRGWRRRRMRT